MRNRLVVVTGGSRGIGAAVARQAAASGYAVLVNYRDDSDGALRVVREIRGAGATAEAVRGDVGVERDVLALFAAADRTNLPLAGLVNNAGMTGGFARLQDLAAETLARVLTVNVVGAFLCAREAAKRMSTERGGQGGAIVNMSSRAAQLGGAGEWIHYAASKGAVDTLTIGLAKELGREGIRVNAVAPGLIDTELHGAAGDPDRVRRLASGVPMGRPGLAEEVAEAVLWLISPAAAYVTGAIVPVAGGR
ncbi:MAG TPA: SDR family oxidoreductase [Stellaceae bacterium]|nr:SDR family oxidoreductase [Stellaceae bacterium]